MSREQLQLVSFAVALIRNPRLEQPRWMTRYNPVQNQLEFVVAPRLQKESFRETVIREVAWQLNLDRKRDFLVSNMAQTNLDFTGALAGDRVESRFAVAFYNVELYRQYIIKRLDESSDNIWLTSREIWNGESDEGVLIDPRIHSLIRRSEVIQSRS